MSFSRRRTAGCWPETCSARCEHKTGESYPSLKLSCCRMRQGQEIHETERKTSIYLGCRVGAVSRLWVYPEAERLSRACLVIAASQASFSLWSRSRELLATCYSGRFVLPCTWFYSPLANELAILGVVEGAEKSVVIVRRVAERGSPKTVFLAIPIFHASSTTFPMSSFHPDLTSVNLKTLQAGEVRRTQGCSTPAQERLSQLILKGCGGFLGPHKKSKACNGTQTR